VHCKNAIFIMTSNLAQREIGDEGVALRDEASRSGLGSKPTDQGMPRTWRWIFSQPDDTAHPGRFRTMCGCPLGVTVSRKFVDNVVMPILHRHFHRDEFLGRINEILFFLPFDHQERLEIARKELQLWAGRAQERHQVTLSWDEDVLEKLQQGYNVRFGARSIKNEGAPGAVRGRGRGGNAMLTARCPMDVVPRRRQWTSASST